MKLWQILVGAGVLVGGVVLLSAPSSAASPPKPAPGPAPGDWDPRALEKSFSAKDWAIRQAALSLIALPGSGHTVAIKNGAGCGQPCNPGDADGVPGSKTRAAIKAANQRFLDVAKGKADTDWGPMFALWPDVWTAGTEKYAWTVLMAHGNDSDDQLRSLSNSIAGQLDHWPPHPHFDMDPPLPWPPKGWSW